MEALLGLFAASFAAATLIPLPSEAALFAYLQLHPDKAALAVAVATLGNTAGGMTSYLIGRLIPERTQSRLNPRAIQSVRRYGAPITVLAWLPIIGDALCVAAGWLRVNWAAALAFMAVGRLARYLVVAVLSSPL
jgi:membrane protein YqaA with SNARE-associated domain